MGSFTYFQKGKETYLDVDKRMTARWHKRMVPAADSIAILPESITLSKSSYTIKEETTYTLTATVKPDNASVKTVSWSSSDEEVATVNDSGKITGVKAGECKIIATCNGDSSVKAECSLTVESKE